jgi:fumarylacetoacetate (FAA) hydrolase
MKYLTFAQTDDISHPCLGVMKGETIVDLVELQTWAQGARSIPSQDLPESLLGLIYSDPLTKEYISRLVSAVQDENPLMLKGAHRKPVGYLENKVVLYPPLPNPESLRNFSAFEAHITNVYSIRDVDIPQEWYEFPAFYFSNPHATFGTSSVISYPSNSAAMDFGLTIACVIGKAGINITPEEAEEYIFGYTMLNDWTARDIQRKEAKVGIGPAKSKDFATSLGPWIVTPDELQDRSTDRPGVYDLSMQARVNGEQRTSGNWKDIHYSFGEMISYASQGAYLLPGEVLSSGTVGGGCLMELTKGAGPWLKPGDIVELEIEGLGILTNQIGAVN